MSSTYLQFLSFAQAVNWLMQRLYITLVRLFFSFSVFCKASLFNSYFRLFLFLGILLSLFSLRYVSLLLLRCPHPFIDRVRLSWIVASGPPLHVLSCNSVHAGLTLRQNPPNQLMPDNTPDLKRLFSESATTGYFHTKPCLSCLNWLFSKLVVKKRRLCFRFKWQQLVAPSSSADGQSCSDSHHAILTLFSPGPVRAIITLWFVSAPYVVGASRRYYSAKRCHT